MAVLKWFGERKKEAEADKKKADLDEKLAELHERIGLLKMSIPGLKMPFAFRRIEGKELEEYVKRTAALPLDAVDELLTVVTEIEKRVKDVEGTYKIAEGISVLREYQKLIEEFEKRDEGGILGQIRWQLKRNKKFVIFGCAAVFASALITNYLVGAYYKKAIDESAPSQLVDTFLRSTKALKAKLNVLEAKTNELETRANAQAGRISGLDSSLNENKTTYEKFKAEQDEDHKKIGIEMYSYRTALRYELWRAIEHSEIILNARIAGNEGTLNNYALDIASLNSRADDSEARTNLHGKTLSELITEANSLKSADGKNSEVTAELMRMFEENARKQNEQYSELERKYAELKAKYEAVEAKQKEIEEKIRKTKK